jgi:hypothetical protein
VKLRRLVPILAFTPPCVSNAVTVHRKIELLLALLALLVLVVLLVPSPPATL